VILSDTPQHKPLFASEDGSHWYYPDGRPCHAVPNKSKPGTQRNTTLKDARKLGLLPSVTTLLKILDRPGLNNWRCEMAVLAALTLPRKPDEKDDDFARRVATDADTIRDEAADFGKLLHANIEDYAKFIANPNAIATKPWDMKMVPFMNHVEDWFRNNIDFGKPIYAEQVVVNQQLGYAGLRDLKAWHKTHGLCVIDFKSQGVKQGAKINFYPEWVKQLALYDIADDSDGPAKLLSVVIDSRNPQPLQEKVWSDEEAARSRKAVELIALLWMIERNYVPECSKNLALGFGIVAK
jgi:hypothetical protein